MKHFSSLSKAQTRNIILILAAIILAVFALTGTSAGTLAEMGIIRSHAQTQLAGEWTGSLSTRNDGQVQINFTRRSEKGYGNNGSTYKIADLQGFTGDVKAQARADVSFRLVREAGTITCEGFFQSGHGAGTWTFTPNASFASAMASRGLGQLTDEDILRAAFHDLTTRYADEIKGAGYDKLTFNDLIRAQNHDISLAYIRDLRSSGITDLSMDDLIRASNHDISAEYIRSVRSMGFGNLGLDKLIQLQNHDITADFVGQMRSSFGDSLTIEQLINLSNHDVDGKFVSDIKSEGFPSITPDVAIRLKNHDVNREFIQKAKAQGYANASLDELIRLASRGVIK